ncbi:putative DNA-binding protein [Brochothrix campestris]|uniref:UPF0122 protein BCAMP_00550 n=1 Tax=Brochothrix campestris FSL F6-1037 TaxID=1265861 RepID=W7DAE5_9LIST|nr:putative DNA-binding protein [Brochothrix campestris]EUJ42233.1 DNA-binding protein [Brochothrix campestris FSL F6-1037]
MLEKTTRINMLFAFYQRLLTEKQSIYMTLYYEDDFSLGEIAEEYEVSRQAVYDNIKRTVKILETYEEKLGLVGIFKQQNELVATLRARLVEKDVADTEITTLLNQLDEINLY